VNTSVYKGKRIRAGIFVQDVPCGEIVHTVDNNGAISYQFSNVILYYLFGKCLNGYVGIYLSECFASGSDLAFPDVFVAVQYLTIQVGKFGFPAVTNPEGSNTGSREVDSNGTTQATCSRNKDSGLLNLFLTDFIPTGKDDLSPETFLVVGGQ
jgi:hypothetical protein